MAGTIILFPPQSANDDDVQLTGGHLRRSFPLAPRDPELSLLIEMCQSLLSHYDDGLCDRFVDRLDRWEADNRRG